MKTQIRFGVWETNSSSVNTLTVMTPEEYKDYMNKWESDDWMWDNYEYDWVRAENIEVNDIFRYINNPCDNENNWNNLNKETTTYTTKHGDEIVVVSIYGYEG